MSDSPASSPIRVLFLCSNNSARSQMAEGWLRAIGGDDFEVHSAGSTPKGLSPLAVTVMADAGIDISHQESKGFDRYLNERFDVVITVCDRVREQCPTFPGDPERIHWSFDDPNDPNIPEEDRPEAFRRVRDAIKWRVSLFANAQRHSAAGVAPGAEASA